MTKNTYNLTTPQKYADNVLDKVHSHMERLPKSLSKLVTVRQFVLIYPAWTQSGMRWLIFNENQNGLNMAIVRIGRKVLIDVDKFEEWVKEIKENPRKWKELPVDNRTLKRKGKTYE
jgi:hypothetical protein